MSWGGSISNTNGGQPSPVTRTGIPNDRVVTATSTKNLPGVGSLNVTTVYGLTPSGELVKTDLQVPQEMAGPVRDLFKNLNRMSDAQLKQVYDGVTVLTPSYTKAELTKLIPEDKIKDYFFDRQDSQGQTVYFWKGHVDHVDPRLQPLLEVPIRVGHRDSGGNWHELLTLSPAMVRKMNGGVLTPRTFYQTAAQASLALRVATSARAQVRTAHFNALQTSVRASESAYRYIVAKEGSILAGGLLTGVAVAVVAAPVLAGALTESTATGTVGRVGLRSAGRAATQAGRIHWSDRTFGWGVVSFSTGALCTFAYVLSTRNQKGRSGSGGGGSGRSNVAPVAVASPVARPTRAPSVAPSSSPQVNNSLADIVRNSGVNSRQLVLDRPIPEHRKLYRYISQMFDKMGSAMKGRTVDGLTAEVMIKELHLEGEKQPLMLVCYDKKGKVNYSNLVIKKNAGGKNSIYSFDTNDNKPLSEEWDDSKTVDVNLDKMVRGFKGVSSARFYQYDPAPTKRMWFYLLSDGTKKFVEDPRKLDLPGQK